MAEPADGSQPLPLTELVADPSPENADTLALVLAACGHRALTALAAADALALAAGDPPDVLITEAVFADGDGFDLAAQFIAGRPGRPLRILLTARNLPAERVREAGFDGHFVKPADLEAVLALLANHATRRPRPTA